MSAMVADTLFASFDTDLHLERIAGGNETEVYRTDDACWVVKVKTEPEYLTGDPYTEAKLLRATADAFARAVGSEYSLPNYYLIGQNQAGLGQIVVFQPYLDQAKPLFEVDYRALDRSERAWLARQLRQIIKRALAFYRETGRLPDLYGRTSRNPAERRSLNASHRLPWRMWEFLVKRTLLRANNLMFSHETEPRLVLVDYDPVKRSKLYQWVYYTVRRCLFWRDYALIYLMEKTGYVPEG
ncbi:MAG TPA: hypothetical protein PKD98_04360 [Anaerolineae bacterium]|nr:hypothetical protein [Anaerolineae bacterium]